MAEKTREVEVKLKAVDETGHAFESVKERLEEFIHHNRQTGKLIKETMEFAGGAIAAHVITETLETAAKSMREYTEAVESGHATTTQYAFAILGAIPVIGEISEAAAHATDAYRDMRAAQMEAAGASEEAVEKMMSVPTYWKKQAEALQETRESYALLQNTINTFINQSVARVGINPVEAQVAAENQRHLAEADKLRMATLDFKLKHPHMSEQQKADFEQMQQAQETEQKAHELAIKNIKERAALAEQDFQRDQDHQEIARQQEHNHKLADLQAQAKADRIRTFHEEFAAEAYLRKQALDAQLKLSQEAEAEQQRQFQELARKRAREGKAFTMEEMGRRVAEISAQGTQEREAMKARAEQAEVLANQQFQNQQKDAEDRAQSDLFKSQAELLQARGTLGDREAQKGAERLKLLLSERQQIDAIDKTLRERNDLTGKQIEMLQAQQDVIHQTTATQLKQLELQQIMGDPLRLYATSSFTNGGAGLAAKEGVRANAETERGRQLEQIARGSLSEQVTTNALLREIYAALQPKGLQPPNLIAMR